MFSEYRYNTTVSNPCNNGPCPQNNLCLLIPGGYRCACPETSSEEKCDATNEPPRPSPLRCPCQNRGVCTGVGTVQCQCPSDYEGVHCETHLLRARTTPSDSVAPAYIIVPLLLIIAVLGGAAVYVFFFRRNGRAKGAGFTGFGGSPSVSFRQGTNVEFGPAAFPANGSSTGVPSFYHFIPQTCF